MKIENCNMHTATGTWEASFKGRQMLSAPQTFDLLLASTKLLSEKTKTTPVAFINLSKHYRSPKSCTWTWPPCSGVWLSMCAAVSIRIVVLELAAASSQPFRFEEEHALSILF